MNRGESKQGMGEDKPPTASLNAVILVGGESRRMGMPKHLVEIEGISTTETILNVVAPHVDSLYAAGRGLLPALPYPVTHLHDVPQFRGPAAGILSALACEPQAQWLVVACDQPLITTDAIRWLLSFADNEYVAVLPRTRDGRIQPIFALYRKGAKSLLEQSEHRGLKSLQAHPDVHCPDVPASLEDAWKNMNTPQDLETLFASRKQT